MLKRDTPLTDADEAIVRRVIGCAITVHRELGPGFRERIYASALRLELHLCGLRFEAEKAISVLYKEWEIPGQRVDLVVENILLVETKTVSRLKRIHAAQVQSYLKTMGLHIGLIFNFSAPTIRAGLRRVVLSESFRQHLNAGSE